MNDKNQSGGQTQNAQAKKPWYKKWWVITIGVIVLLIIIGNSGGNKDGKQTSQTQPSENTASESASKKEENPAEPEKLTPQITVKSADISKEYSENEVAADEKYKDKIIEVSGKVSSVDNGIADNEMIVKLSDEQYDISGTMCYMKADEKSKVLTLKKGQQVTLIGKGNSATLGSPMLKDCVIK